MISIRSRLRMAAKTQQVKCQGCGQEIDPEAKDLRDIEYARTKRGSDVFFHRGCMSEVWKRKSV